MVRHLQLEIITIISSIKASEINQPTKATASQPSQPPTTSLQNTLLAQLFLASKATPFSLSK